MPFSDVVSVSVTSPATTAHSPARSRTFPVYFRLAITGIPLAAWPVNSLNSDSISSETSSLLWIRGVTFSVNPRSSNCTVGGA